MGYYISATAGYGFNVPLDILDNEVYDILQEVTHAVPNNTLSFSVSNFFGDIKGAAILSKAHSLSTDGEPIYMMPETPDLTPEELEDFRYAISSLDIKSAVQFVQVFHVSYE